MKSFRHFIAIIILLVLPFFLLPTKAYAYLDLGTGSYIFQLIVATLIGALFAVKLFWNKVKTFFNNFFSREKKD